MAFWNKKNEKQAQEKQHAHEMAMAQKTIDANKSMQLDEYTRNRSSWDQQNQYNTPEAQQQRFKDAGLNPNLMYGQGSHGNASEMPKYSSPTADYTGVSAPTLGPQMEHAIKQDNIKNLMQTTGMYLNIKKSNAELDQMKMYSNPKIAAETQRTDFQTEGMRIDQNLKKNLTGYADDNNPLGKALTPYNQRQSDIVDQQLDQMQKANIRSYLENQLKSKTLSREEEKNIQSWIQTLAPIATKLFGK